MKVSYHKNFAKSYKKLSPKIKEQFKKRLQLFLENPFHPVLNNHALHGEWRNFRSINISGNFRAIYKQLDDYVFEFVIIDTHGNLY